LIDPTSHGGHANLPQEVDGPHGGPAGLGGGVAVRLLHLPRGLVPEGARVHDARAVGLRVRRDRALHHVADVLGEPVASLLAEGVEELGLCAAPGTQGHHGEPGVDGQGREDEVVVGRGELLREAVGQHRQAGAVGCQGWLVRRCDNAVEPLLVAYPGATATATIAAAIAITTAIA
jgi:hypothetical protein